MKTLAREAVGWIQQISRGIVENSVVPGWDVASAPRSPLNNDTSLFYGNIESIRGLSFHTTYTILNIKKHPLRHAH